LSSAEKVGKCVGVVGASEPAEPRQRRRFRSAKISAEAMIDYLSDAFADSTDSTS